MHPYSNLIKAIDTLDRIEADERSVMDDDGIPALIELSDHRDTIRACLDLAAGLRWYLFLVWDYEHKQVLLSVQAETEEAAEALAKARATESWTLHHGTLETELVGVTDRDINKQF